MATAAKVRDALRGMGQSGGDRRQALQPPPAVMLLISPRATGGWLPWEKKGGRWLTRCRVERRTGWGFRSYAGQVSAGNASILLKYAICQLFRAWWLRKWALTSGFRATTLQRVGSCDTASRQQRDRKQLALNLVTPWAANRVATHGPLLEQHSWPALNTLKGLFLVILEGAMTGTRPMLVVATLRAQSTLL